MKILLRNFLLCFFVFQLNILSNEKLELSAGATINSKRVESLKVTIAPSKLLSDYRLTDPGEAVHKVLAEGAEGIIIKIVNSLTKKEYILKLLKEGQDGSLASFLKTSHKTLLDQKGWKSQLEEELKIHDQGIPDHIVADKRYKSASVFILEELLLAQTWTHLPKGRYPATIQVGKNWIIREFVNGSTVMSLAKDPGAVLRSTEDTILFSNDLMKFAQEMTDAKVSYGDLNGANLMFAPDPNPRPGEEGLMKLIVVDSTPGTLHETKPEAFAEIKKVLIERLSPYRSSGNYKDMTDIQRARMQKIVDFIASWTLIGNKIVSRPVIPDFLRTSYVLEHNPPGTEVKFEVKESIDGVDITRTKSLYIAEEEIPSMRSDSKPIQRKFWTARPLNFDINVDDQIIRFEDHGKITLSKGVRGSAKASRLRRNIGETLLESIRSSEKSIEPFRVKRMTLRH